MMTLHGARQPVVRSVQLLAALFLGFALTGCKPPEFETVRQYPPRSIPVRFVPAMDKADCLVAASVMTGNYILGREDLTSREVRAAAATAGLDQTRVGDMQQILTEWRLELIPLRGTLRGEPPLSLDWWVNQRGYPVICVINQSAGQSDYNHAVVVIGVHPGESPGEGKVIVLDPAFEEWLLTWDEITFLHYWGSAGCVMLPMVEKQVPSGSTEPPDPRTL